MRAVKNNFLSTSVAMLRRSHGLNQTVAFLMPKGSFRLEQLTWKSKIDQIN